jgi:bifunctional UDP-N-acetylglucosamine pyrophosphorylase/glucosamine-1-phosphate N-acetyltransferase
MTDSTPPVAIVLAAGKGKRMKSHQPKVLHKLVGKPMVEYVVDAARAAGANRIILVIGHNWTRMHDYLRGLKVEFVVQKEQLGTGHAVLQAKGLLSDFEGDVVVLCGDVPALGPATLRSLLQEHRAHRAAATVLTAVPKDPSGYGRIIRDDKGDVQGIVEDKDASADQKNIGEINTGTFCFDKADLFSVLELVSSDNEQKEYYLTDTLRLLLDRGLPVRAVVVADPRETLGVNSQDELEAMEEFLRRR